MRLSENKSMMVDVTALLMLSWAVLIGAVRMVVASAAKDPITKKLIITACINAALLAICLAHHADSCMFSTVRLGPGGCLLAK